MGSSKKPRYNGPTEQDVTAQRDAYNQQIGLLQQQNTQLQSQLGDANKSFKDSYDQRLSLLGQQQSQNNQYYSSLLATSQAALADSRAKAAATEAQYAQLGQQQRDAVTRQGYESERSSIMAQENSARMVSKQQQRTRQRPTNQVRLYN